MKHIQFFLLLLLFLVFAMGACSDAKMEPIGPDSNAPEVVSEVKVKPLAGGAYISYNVPDDPNLLYVQARYNLPNGELVVKNASSNTPGITLEGFFEEIEYEVSLISVNRGGKASEPYVVRFTPNTSPLKSVYESLELSADFGGIRLTWDNPTAAELALLIYRKDSLGDDMNIDSYYTSSKLGQYATRGLDTLTSEFSVKIRDKWNNYSELKREKLTPLFEIKLDKHNFSTLGEAYSFGTKEFSKINRVWDGNKETGVFDDYTLTTYPWYASFTISDKPILVSRFIWNQFGWPFNDFGHYYAHQNVRGFEIYSHADEIPPIKLEEWTFVGSYEIIKPSGLPVTGIGRDNMSQEDYDLARSGHMFDFPPNSEPLRHIRIRIIDCFQGGSGSFSEIEFFGDTRGVK